MNSGMIEAGVVLMGSLVFLGIAYWLSDWVNRRAFNRTNSSGVQTFENYNDMKSTRGTEGCVKLVSKLFSCLGCLGVSVAAMVFIAAFWFGSISTSDKHPEILEEKTDKAKKNDKALKEYKVRR